jgi:hypothetical protein
MRSPKIRHGETRIPEICPMEVGLAEKRLGKFHTLKFRQMQSRARQIRPAQSRAREICGGEDH